jgi:hypothetical protein
VIVKPSVVGVPAASETTICSAPFPPGSSVELFTNRNEGRAAPRAAPPASVTSAAATQTSRRGVRIVGD